MNEIKELQKMIYDLNLALNELNYRLKTLQEDEQKNTKEIEKIKEKINELEDQLRDIQVRVNQTVLLFKTFVSIAGGVATVWGAIQLFV